MRVLTVPRSMASSFLKNFSMNFTATVPPPKWQAPGKRVTNFRTATRMPERKNDCALGDVLELTQNQCGSISRRRMTTVRRDAGPYHFRAFRMTRALLWGRASVAALLRARRLMDH